MQKKRINTFWGMRRGNALLSISLLSLVLFSNQLSAQEFDPTKALKDYAGPTFIGSHIGFAGTSGVIEGPNVENNRNIMLQNLNSVQPAVYPAWGGTFPASKPASVTDITFDTDKLNTLVNWADDNDLHIVHHVSFSQNFYYPNWFWSATYDEEELDSILVRSIRSIMTDNDNKDKVDVWNLINEVFQDRNGKYRPDGAGERDLRWTRMGWEEDASGLTGSAKVNDQHPIFIRRVFEEAAIASGKLEFRDFGILEVNDKSNGIYQLVSHLKAKGTRIDALGLQCHVAYNQGLDAGTFNRIRKNIRRFKNLGLEVYITEMDVGRWESDLSISKEEYFSRQGEVWYELIKLFREEGIDMIHTWGMTDGTMGTWREGQEAWLFDTNYERKNAYQEYLRALSEPAIQSGSSINYVSAPTAVKQGGTANVQINYSVFEQQDVVIQFENGDDGFKTVATMRETVEPGSGIVSFDLPIDETAEKHTNYRWRMMTTDIGGAWNDKSDFAFVSGVEVKPLIDEFVLSVFSGDGDGSYIEGENVTVTANEAPAGKVFDQWIGDTDGLTDPTSPTTVYTVGANAADIRATYKDEIITSTAFTQVKEDISVYPNPVSDFLYVDYKTSSSAALPSQIIDMMGRTVLTISSNTTKVNLNKLDVGIYIFRAGDHNIRFKKQ